MTNNERILSNNEELRECIEIAESLPEAGGASPVIEGLTVTENGTFTAPDGVDGYSPVTVNVPVPDGYIKPSGTKNITENGTHDIKQYESVEVAVPIPSGYVKPSGSLNISENGSYDVIEKAEVVVAVPTPTPVLQEKTVTPTTSTQTVTPDAGKDGLSKVTVNAMPTATQATPSISVDSAGKITASATQTAGYVVAGTKSATKQLTTQAAQTITPGTSDKTIASGRYLTGTQTIKGDSNLVAGNIKSGVSIFGVAGIFEGSGASGGTAETCTVIIQVSSNYAMRDFFVYNSPTGVVVEPAGSTYTSKTLTVVKGSMLVFAWTRFVGGPSVTVGGQVQLAYADGEYYTVAVANGNGSISFNDPSAGGGGTND